MSLFHVHWVFICNTCGFADDWKKDDSSVLAFPIGLRVQRSNLLWLWRTEISLTCWNASSIRRPDGIAYSSVTVWMEIEEVIFRIEWKIAVFLIFNLFSNRPDAGDNRQTRIPLSSRMPFEETAAAGKWDEMRMPWEYVKQFPFKLRNVIFSGIQFNPILFYSLKMELRFPFFFSISTEWQNINCFLW